MFRLKLTCASPGSMARAAQRRGVREVHTATLLPNGNVLVVGDWALSARAELYNPATGTWAPTSSMRTGRYSHTATLLSNGKVLVTGGDVAGGQPTQTAELYDPA